MKRWCRVYSCWREAVPGSDFCRVKHGWWEDTPATVVLASPPPPPPAPEPVEAPPVLMLVRDCVGCEESFEQPPRQGRPFGYCETCRGIAA